MNTWVKVNYRIMLAVSRFMIKHNILRKQMIALLMYNEEV